MILKLTCLFIVLSTSNVFGQGIKKCDSAILLMTMNESGTLNQEQIRSFLITMGNACKDDVEFSEWSNELLFSILDKQTVLTLKTIERNEKILEMNVIFEYLSSPISDINVKGLISKIEKVIFKNALKKQIISRLKLLRVRK